MVVCPSFAVLSHSLQHSLGHTHNQVTRANAHMGARVHKTYIFRVHLVVLVLGLGKDPTDFSAVTESD